MFPAISDLRRHFPDAEIHWLVEPAFAEVVSWHGAVDQTITVPLRAHKKIWWKIPGLLNKLRQQLRAKKYNVVLDAQGLIKSALLARLGGTSVFGFDSSGARESLAARLYDKTANIPSGLHVIEKNRQLVEVLFKADISAKVDYGLEKYRRGQMQIELSETLKVFTSSPYLVLLHGTTWNSKYWPEKYWLELIQLLSERGLRCLIPWGNEIEHQRAKYFQIKSGEFVQVLPKLSLSELMRVLLHAHAFISVETGIGHLAAVFDVPGIMLHGPTNPEYSGILQKNCVHLTSGIKCSPCFKRDCPKLQKAKEIPPCQNEIKPLLVFNRCQELLSTNSEETTA